MYYKRVLKDSTIDLLKQNGQLRWLFEFVKSHKELDFLVGKNNRKEWISVYRGLSRIFIILPNGQNICIDGDQKYQDLQPDLFGIRSINQPFQTEIKSLINKISAQAQFDRYYNNKKEGYYQNILSRRFGICGSSSDEFVILDKEVVIGYKDEAEKQLILGTMQSKYKALQCEFSQHYPEAYGKDLSKKSVGNELDFLGLDKHGNLLVIEYKHGTNTSGIYLSPLQIGLYLDIFNAYIARFSQELQSTIFKMLKQKQEIGLINSDWIAPASIKEVIPVLIISACNYRSCAKQKYSEIMNICRNRLGQDFLNDIRTYNYTLKNGLSAW